MGQHIGHVDDVYQAEFFFDDIDGDFVKRSAMCGTASLPRKVYGDRSRIYAKALDTNVLKSALNRAVV